MDTNATPRRACIQPSGHKVHARIEAQTSFGKLHRGLSLGIYLNLSTGPAKRLGKTEDLRSIGTVAKRQCLFQNPEPQGYSSRPLLSDAARRRTKIDMQIEGLPNRESASSRLVEVLLLMDERVRQRELEYKREHDEREQAQRALSQAERTKRDEERLKLDMHLIQSQQQRQSMMLVIMRQFGGSTNCDLEQSTSYQPSPGPPEADP
jgi:3-dehydroquinate synthetase